jgi:hypothetical protein
MAEYIVLETSFINNSLVEPGARVEYDGKPGKNLQPVKKAKGKAAEAEAPPAEAEAAEGEQLA